jgi:hypothetical protein
MRKFIVVTIILTVNLIFLFIGFSIVPASIEIEFDPKTYIGTDAYKDQFPVLIGEIDEQEAPTIASIRGESIDTDLPYKKHLIELPLVRCDYYYGKHINATAAANEINQIKVLKPGDRISLIGNGYLTMARSRGYVSPGSGFLYASGACWTSSTLGTLMDEVNKAFSQKYNKPLFVFYAGDRSPHPVAYSTYQKSNYGKGYAVTKMPGGYGTDYRFTINPSLENDPQFSDLKIKIVMISRTDNPQAYLGQSLGAYVLSNIDF